MPNNPQDKMPGAIRVAIVEDCADILLQTAVLLDAEPDIKCVGKYVAAEDLTADMDRICPDVVLMSIGLPGQDGIACVRHLKPRYPSVWFVMFTAQHSRAPEAMQAGASGYLAKPELPENVIAAVREVMDGDAGMRGGCCFLILNQYNLFNYAFCRM